MNHGSHEVQGAAQGAVQDAAQCLEYTGECTGEFTKIHSETYYVIKNVDAIPPFFISLVSDQDHWLFTGSLGGITAGRVSPETALFPYQCVDKLYDNYLSSGARTLISLSDDSKEKHSWEPFNLEHDGKYQTRRNLYKNALGNKLCFEEINDDLKLLFRYTWQFSDEFGLCRYSQLLAIEGFKGADVSCLDGLLNVLPAGTPEFTQTVSSNLVDAYKYTELDSDKALATYTLYSAISDKAEAAESLRANTVFSSECLVKREHKADSGIVNSRIYIHPRAFEAFKRSKPLTSDIVQSVTTRGIRGAYLKHSEYSLSAGDSLSWWMAANNELSQSKVIDLQTRISSSKDLATDISQSVERGCERLKRIIGAADGLQVSGEQMVCQHHYANVLFNVLRGGIFANHYQISKHDFLQNLKHFNIEVFKHFSNALHELADSVSVTQLQDLVNTLAGQSEHLTALRRLSQEYLPITFGRRHGDPSRPWNKFEIRLKDEHEKAILSYQGNWRDIFQNWEALCFSYPAFVNSVIAKFVNASTMDGYNPYRITNKGIDWEIEEPDDPWSYIGYWGDHQIIYLLKLLELSQRFYPDALGVDSLLKPIYCYANVPYRIKSYDALCQDAKNTVEYDYDLSQLIEQRCRNMGADGKLVLNTNGQVLSVTLLEKLLVPLLSKLSNLVLGAGIWLNTQRPEWNDANNALVGQGVSCVTLYYIHRYQLFLQGILQSICESEHAENLVFSANFATWLSFSANIVSHYGATINDASMINPQLQKSFLDKMGRSAQAYREAIYQPELSVDTKRLGASQLLRFLTDSQKLVKISVDANRNTNGLYHAYKTMQLTPSAAHVNGLYEMLEGQVAALSSKSLSPAQASTMLDSLFASELYRKDIDTFMLYADRAQKAFLDKNIIQSKALVKLKLWRAMKKAGDQRLLSVDGNGNLRFNASLINAGVLESKYHELAKDYPREADAEALALLMKVYEETFSHEAFTGRSTGMFAFEGLGSVYWHMVSKLLLAIQEVAFDAFEQQDKAYLQLVSHYYRVRRGIGFNQSPQHYGAFPFDPYSHTPKHAGAQQPGMTGQVKEEIITRLGELGCWPQQGTLVFKPFLLRAQEFLTAPEDFEYLYINQQWRHISLEAGQLAFTLCQVPIVYHINDSAIGLNIHLADGSMQSIESNTLPAKLAREIFDRSATLTRLDVYIPTAILHKSEAG